ncbi:YwaF family protein [Enterocloster lavalensis]|uniref:TMEM164 family acyltransferase n=1 Tax=Enterocloster lavalensis TaxID=460384 RepID=UPI002666DDFB|nr:YwaF family protein [Enterocloster lavalensis]
MQDLIQRFFQAAAWPMQTPVPYSPFHLCAAALGVFVAVRAARKLASAPKERVLFACGSILAASELLKQGFLYYVVNGRSYDWWYFPFQLCSIPMYLCLIFPLLSGPGMARARRAVCTFIQDFGLLGGVMALAEPSGLFHPYWALTLHGLCWHFMLIFLGLYCAGSGGAGRERAAYLDTLPLFAACCAVAMLINVAAHPYGNADMFYISPYYPNGQIVFHQIALEIGITAGNLIYLTGVALGGWICHVACRRFAHRRASDHFTA